ncbi:uncharacterized protein LOC122811902 isoform X2 [Protopterus annectens]|uniref:uncharacterized protein LOC122811902 isoform X2 n=1 Tax=Protopterus annectens TaxID=7888 RepID=UPI001CFA46B4|nr:uncharacterized protein LOC122811902 isoform X2 [Protopterus annectens]
MATTVDDKAATTKETSTEAFDTLPLQDAENPPPENEYAATKLSEDSGSPPVPPVKPVMFPASNGQEDNHEGQIEQASFTDSGSPPVPPVKPVMFPASNGQEDNHEGQIEQASFTEHDVFPAPVDQNLSACGLSNNKEDCTAMLHIADFPPPPPPDMGFEENIIWHQDGNDEIPRFLNSTDADLDGDGFPLPLQDGSEVF